MLAVAVLCWLCVGLIVWTDVAYPVVAGLVARVRPRPARSADHGRMLRGVTPVKEAAAGTL